MSNYFGMKRPETNNPNELKDYITALERRIEELEGHIRLLLSKKYSSSSERTVPGQLQLPIFNEAEAEASPSQPEPTYETVTYTRRKTPRGPSAVNADNLSVDERIDYELSEEKRVCPQCGDLLHEMSTQSHKELEVIPAQIKVVEHVQHIYSCRHCEKQEISTPIIKAPVPASPIPGSMASPSALAYVMNQKYVESMPLYRQEQSFEKEGITLTRQTLANWIIKASELWLELLYQCLYPGFPPSHNDVL
jgi:transposase